MTDSPKQAPYPWGWTRPNNFKETLRNRASEIALLAAAIPEKVKQFEADLLTRLDEKKASLISDQEKLADYEAKQAAKKAERTPAVIFLDRVRKLNPEDLEAFKRLLLAEMAESRPLTELPARAVAPQPHSQHAGAAAPRDTSLNEPVATPQTRVTEPKTSFSVQSAAGEPVERRPDPPPVAPEKPAVAASPAGNSADSSGIKRW